MKKLQLWLETAQRRKFWRKWSHVGSCLTVKLSWSTQSLGRESIAAGLVQGLHPSGGLAEIWEEGSPQRPECGFVISPHWNDSGKKLHALVKSASLISICNFPFPSAKSTFSTSPATAFESRWLPVLQGACLHCTKHWLLEQQTNEQSPCGRSSQILLLLAVRTLFIRPFSVHL